MIPNEMTYDEVIRFRERQDTFAAEALTETLLREILTHEQSLDTKNTKDQTLKYGIEDAL